MPNDALTREVHPRGRSAPRLGVRRGNELVAWRPSRALLHHGAPTLLGLRVVGAAALAARGPIRTPAAAPSCVARGLRRRRAQAAAIFTPRPKIRPLLNINTTPTEAIRTHSEIVLPDPRETASSGMHDLPRPLLRATRTLAAIPRPSRRMRAIGRKGSIRTMPVQPLAPVTQCAFKFPVRPPRVTPLGYTMWSGHSIVPPPLVGNTASQGGASHSLVACVTVIPHDAPPLRSAAAALGSSAECVGNQTLVGPLLSTILGCATAAASYRGIVEGLIGANPPPRKLLAGGPSTVIWFFTSPITARPHPETLWPTQWG